MGRMNQWILIAVLSVVEALRRFWQKITGRVPVPVRVRQSFRCQVWC